MWAPRYLNFQVKCILLFPSFSRKYSGRVLFSVFSVASFREEGKYMASVFDLASDPTCICRPNVLKWSWMIWAAFPFHLSFGRGIVPSLITRRSRILNDIPADVVLCPVRCPLSFRKKWKSGLLLEGKLFSSVSMTACITKKNKISTIFFPCWTPVSYVFLQVLSDFYVTWQVWYIMLMTLMRKGAKDIVFESHKECHVRWIQMISLNWQPEHKIWDHVASKSYAHFLMSVSWHPMCLNWYVIPIFLVLIKISWWWWCSQF